MSKLTVTYIKHSGFLIETANSYLLFDYWQGKLPELQYDKELYIFSSHAHHDHYTKDIFKLENKCQRVVYVLSSDIKRASSFWKKAENVIFMKPHEEKEIDGCVISTLKSTDEGVAFLVKTEGKTIYHAGDLHWWANCCPGAVIFIICPVRNFLSASFLYFSIISYCSQQCIGKMKCAPTFFIKYSMPRLPDSSCLGSRTTKAQSIFSAFKYSISAL